MDPKTLGARLFGCSFREYVILLEFRWVVRKDELFSSYFKSKEAKPNEVLDYCRVFILFYFGFAENPHDLAWLIVAGRPANSYSTNSSCGTVMLFSTRIEPIAYLE